MGNIKAFLQPPVMEDTKKIVISDRFKDEKGEPVPFIIRAISQEVNDRITRQSTKRTKKQNMVIRELDDEKYMKLLIQACVVEPNFKDSEMCAYYKTMDPLDVPGRMLSVGEYTRLAQEIRAINGLLMSDEELEEVEEEAKN